MRKFLTLLVATALLWQSCSDDSLDPVVKLGAAPTFTAPTNNNFYVLEETNAAQKFDDFSWTAADFGFQAATTYSVELDKEGNDFAEPVTLGTSIDGELPGITVEKVNSILLAKGIPVNVASKIQFRVKAKVSNDVAELVSQPITLNITPYETIVDYPKLQVPGSYQGWKPEDTNTVIYSLNSDEKYEGYMYFADANTEFKYTKGLSWDTNWGDDGADGTLEPGGANLKAVDAGMYKLNVDLNTLTHTYALTSWGLIGSATSTGWDSDTNLDYDASTGHLKITTDLSAGEIKFRANDAWDINLGDDDTNGSLEYGGANIPIAEAGNYTIELVLNAAKYTYIITKN